MFPKISNNKNFENKKSTLILFATLNFSCCLFKDKSYFEQPTIPTVMTKVISVEDEQFHTEYKDKEDEERSSSLALNSLKLAMIPMKNAMFLHSLKRVSKKTAKFASYQICGSKRHLFHLGSNILNLGVDVVRFYINKNPSSPFLSLV
jgi:hypothetical protein